MRTPFNIVPGKILNRVLHVDLLMEQGVQDFLHSILYLPSQKKVFLAVWKSISLNIFVSFISKLISFLFKLLFFFYNFGQNIFIAKCTAAINKSFVSNFVFGFNKYSLSSSSLRFCVYPKFLGRNLPRFLLILLG